MNVRCPTCGKITRLPVSDAGLPVVCVACGNRFTAPAIVPASAQAAVSPSDESLEAIPGTSPLTRAVVALMLTVAGVGIVIAAVFAGRALSDARHPAPVGEHVKFDPPMVPPKVPSSQPLRPATTQSQPTTTAATTAATVPPTQASSGFNTATTTPAHAPPSPKGVTDFIPIPSTMASPALATSSSTLPAKKRPPIAPVHSTGLTDERIGASIKHGVDYLLQQFDPRTGLLSDVEANPHSMAMGQDVLCVYALLQCGQAIDDPRLNPKQPLMKSLINAMKSLPLSTYHWETYSRGLRATALAVYDRPEDRQILTNDAASLVRGANHGAYTYSLRPNIRTDYFRWDNSNSQYGVLGVWSAAETGREVPGAYWQAVRSHWQETQAANGQWDYYNGANRGTHSMTCAGLASLFVAQDWLEPARFDGNVGRQPFTPAVAAGLKWLEGGDNCIDLDHGAYDLYGLERVGLASGFKYFGSHDWYRELAASTIDDQSPDGRWDGRPMQGGRLGGFGLDGEIPRFRVSNGPLVDTAYNLLFLARGRHPILMNKLRFPGYWANRPRDLANLSRFASRQLERPLNWQVVSIDNDWTDWMDSPVLYLASHMPVILSEHDYDKIRSFVENGGLLFTQADGDSPEFNKFAAQLSQKLFPSYELQNLPDNHPLYSTMFKLQPIPGLKFVSNGSRMLMLHSSTDLSRYWEIRDDKNKPVPFQFGTNLFIYAAGKRDLRNRLVSTYIPKVTAAPTATFSIARLSYAGNWDPEPAAWQRFARWFQLATGYGLQIKTIPLRDLKPGDVPFATLTGTARYDLTADEAAAAKVFVDAGGVLLIDTTGGTGPFLQSLQSSLFDKAFPDRSAHVIDPTHPLLTATPNGMDDLSRPRVRLFAIDTLGARADFPELLQSGRGHILFTSLDLTSAMLDTQTWGILGYEPAYAQSFVKNAILWTWDGQKDE